MFRKIFIFLLTCCIISEYSIAQNNENQHIISGVEYYQQKNYAKAISSFKQLIKNGNESAVVYYNLGNSYAKLKNNSEAIWAFEKALKLNPHLKVANDNLQLLNEEIDDEIIHIKSFFLIRWWNSLLQLFHPNTWAILSFLSLCFWIGLLSARWLNMKEIALKYIAVSMSGWVIIMAISIGSYYNYMDHTDAIIIEHNINLHIGPDNRSDKIIELPSGIKVSILDQINEWYKIQLPDLSKGWIHQRDVRII